MRAIRFLAISLFWGSAVLAQRQLPDGPRLLEPDSSSVLHVPMFNSYGPAQCDDSGNMYFNVNSGSFDNGTVLKISADGSETRIFQVPFSTGKDKTFFQEYYVSRDGLVFQLQNLADNTLQMVEFSSDGTVSKRVHLEAPSYLSIERFVVFDDGTTWLWAHYAPRADGELRGKRYAGVFDSFGRLVRTVQPFAAEDDEVNSANLPEGAMIIGADGYLYVLNGQQITVFTERGQVVRKIRYSKPDPDARAMRIDVAGGVAVLTLNTVNKAHQVRSAFLLLDSVTGQQRGYYQPAAELTGRPMLCFNPSIGFTFVGVERGLLKVVTARLR